MMSGVTRGIFKQVSEIEILGPLLLTSTNFIPMMDK